MLGKGPEPAWQQQPLQDPSLAGLVLDVECSSSSGCLGTGTPSLGCPAVPPPRSARPRLYKVSNSHLLHGLNPVFFLPSSSACAAPASPSLQPLPLPIIPRFSLSSPLCSPLAAAASRSVLGRLCQRGRGAGSIPMSGLQWERHCGGRRRWQVLALPISCFFQCTGGRAAAEPDRILGLGCCVRRLFVVHVLLICIFMIKPAAVRCWEDLG